MRSYYFIFIFLISVTASTTLMSQEQDIFTPPLTESPFSSEDNVDTSPDKHSLTDDFFSDDLNTSDLIDEKLVPSDETRIEKSPPTSLPDKAMTTEYEEKLKSYHLTIRDQDFTDSAKLQALNKITARAHILTVKLGEIATFGNLAITLNRCWRAPQTQTPESKVLLFIQEKTPGEETKTVFEGWMFASSPSLSALEHPVYDVRILECVPNKDAQNTNVLKNTPQ